MRLVDAAVDDPELERELFDRNPLLNLAATRTRIAATTVAVGAVVADEDLSHLSSVEKTRHMINADPAKQPSATPHDTAMKAVALTGRIVALYRPLSHGAPHTTKAAARTQMATRNREIPSHCISRPIVAL